MQLEQTHKEPSTDPFERLLSVLSELPTDEAMKALSKGRINQAVRQTIETMALQKDDILKSIVILVRRERIMQKLLEQHYNLEEAKKMLAIDWSTINISFDVDKKD